MQLNSLTRDFYVWVGLLLDHSILVVAEGNLVEEDIPVVEGTPVATKQILVVEEDIPVVDILEEASAALQSRTVVAHADHHLSRARLLVAVRVEVALLAALQEMVLLLVVRMAVPGCSYGSPSLIPGNPWRWQVSYRV